MEMVKDANVALIPIVSSGRALKMICKRWSDVMAGCRTRWFGGPLAGGHLGFKAEDIAKPEFGLKNLFGPVKASCRKIRRFPGNRCRRHLFARGHCAVGQCRRRRSAIGTRFAATLESGASEAFQARYRGGAAPRILWLRTDPGDKPGLPFRVISISPGYREAFAQKAASP